MGQVLTSGGDRRALCREGGVTKKNGNWVSVWHVWRVGVCVNARQQCCMACLPHFTETFLSEPVRIHRTRAAGSLWFGKVASRWVEKMQESGGLGLSMCTPELRPRELGLGHGGRQRAAILEATKRPSLLWPLPHKEIILERGFQRPHSLSAVKMPWANLRGSGISTDDLQQPRCTGSPHT